MKKIILTLLVSAFFAISAISQNTLMVYGYVTNAQNAAPFTNYPVYVESVDSIAGIMIYDTVFTNSTGHYVDTITLTSGATQGYVNVSVLDSCTNSMITQYGYFSPGNMEVNLDFQLCANAPGCVADYTYNTTANPLEIEFTGVSIGSPDTWSWDFGDGTFSAIQNPVHTFSQAGSYPVCLTISSSDTNNNCYDMVCYTIYVNNDTTATNCENYFTYYTNDSLTYSFEGYLVDSVNYQSVDFTWDFGDGTTGVGQYITHSFQQGGVNMYTVCLKTYLIELSGDTCVYTSCQDVYIGNPGGGNCVADFTYYNTNNPLEVAFYDNSTGNPDVWTWSFGDGTTSAIQSPVHTYSQQGTYYVCLTISSIDSNAYCNDTKCYYVAVIDSSANAYTGIVYLQNQMTADAGVVYLMEFDSLNAAVNNIQTASIDPTNGSYTFNSVNPGLYYIQAELDYNSAYYMQYLPTYYYSSLYWPTANIVWFNTGTTYDIYMIAADSNSYAGTGNVNGTVNQITDNYVDNMEVLLLDENNNPLTFVRTNQYGQFDFNNLEYGTYYLHIEMPGITNDQIQVVIDANNPSQTVAIIIENGNAFVGVENPGLINENYIGDVYPNPVVNNAKIKLYSERSQLLTVSVINELGQLMMTKQEYINEGINTLEIESEGLGSGMYYLQLVLENGEALNKMLLKK